LHFSSQLGNFLQIRRVVQCLRFPLSSSAPISRGERQGALAEGFCTRSHRPEKSTSQRVEGAVRKCGK
jgi:hypothetical protein